MVSQNLADLIHEPQFRIWFEFGFIFHDIIEPQINEADGLQIGICCKGRARSRLI